MKHSNAPWILGDANDGGKSLNIIATDDKGEWVIANVNLCMGNESEANARLMVNAPDMLTELRKVVKGCSCYGTPEDDYSACSSCVRIYKLIARIEG